MEIHLLRPGHAVALGRFFEELKEHGVDKVFHPHPLTADAALELANHRGKDLYFVLLDGEDVIGYALLRGWDAGYDVPSLGIAIHPDMEGQGLARLLMHFLRHVAVRRGAKKILLRVHRTNKRAIGLYRSLGYTLTDDDDQRYQLGILNLG
jgi:ribosomal protein S18 acetylase RimI-like enzyme